MNINYIFYIFAVIVFFMYILHLFHIEKYENNINSVFIGYVIAQNTSYDFAKNSWKLYFNTLTNIFYMIPANTTYNPITILWEPNIFENDVTPTKIEDIPSIITFKHPYLHSTPYKFVALPNTYF